MSLVEVVMDIGGEPTLVLCERIGVQSDGRSVIWVDGVDPGNPILLFASPDEIHAECGGLDELLDAFPAVLPGILLASRSGGQADSLVTLARACRITGAEVAGDEVEPASAALARARMEGALIRELSVVASDAPEGENNPKAPSQKMA